MSADVAKYRAKQIIETDIRERKLIRCPMNLINKGEIKSVDPIQQQLEQLDAEIQRYEKEHYGAKRYKEGFEFAVALLDKSRATRDFKPSSPPVGRIGDLLIDDKQAKRII